MPRDTRSRIPGALELRRVAVAQPGQLRALLGELRRCQSSSRLDVLRMALYRHSRLSRYTVTKDRRPCPPLDVAESAASPGSASPNTTCKACSKPITSSYYQVNGSVVCASCRAALDRPAGTRLHRALRATGLGVLAATAGSLLYFAVAAITGR